MTVLTRTIPRSIRESRSEPCGDALARNSADVSISQVRLSASDQPVIPLERRGWTGFVEVLVD